MQASADRCSLVRNTDRRRRCNEVPLKAECNLRLKVRLPPGAEEFAFLTLGAELGGLLVGAAEAFTEGGTFETAEVEVIMAAD